MIGIHLPDRRSGGVEIPSRKFPRPARFIAQIAARSQSLLRPRQFAHHFLVGQTGIPRVRQRFELINAPDNGVIARITIPLSFTPRTTEAA